MKCSHAGWGWLCYILLEIIRSTLFFLVMITFRVNMNSGSLTGFVFFSNMIINSVYFYPALLALPQYLAGYWPFHVILAFYGIWSLEFLHVLVPPFWVSSSLSTLQVISLWTNVWEATLQYGAGDTHTDSTNDSCPPWYVPDQGKCFYSHKLQQTLNQYQQSAELQIGYCMTVTNSGQVVSQCPYTQQTFNSSDLHSIYQVLPPELDEENETLCVKYSCAESVRMGVDSLYTGTMD